MYRHLIDDFLVQSCRNLKAKDFIVKTEVLSKNKKGKRLYLNNVLTRGFMIRLNEFFRTKINVPRIRVGKNQTIETLINVDVFLLSKYLRDEQRKWTPRIPSLQLAN